MAKISALPAGSTTTGAELVAAVQGGITKQIAASLLGGLGYYNVKNYGAVGDGATNDTNPITLAINAAGAAGGGTVFFPKGTYVIRPVNASFVSENGAVYVNYDNIILLGEGKFLSILKYTLWDGDPATGFDNVGGACFRGIGIIVNVAQTGFTMRGLQMNGGGNGNTGNNGAPASPSTGDGFDVTHKAIYFKVNVAHTNVLIEDCYLHHWQGEIIYNGGSLMDRVAIRNNIIGQTNGDAISLSALNLVVEGNEMYECCNAAVENAYLSSGQQVFRNNYVHDCDHHGFNPFPCFDESPWANIEIHDNQFYRCGNAMFTPGARNMRIYNNLVMDCSYAVYMDNPGLGGSGTEFIIANNVEIFNNRFIVGIDTPATPSGIYLYSDSAAPVRSINIHDNWANVTSDARTAGKTFGRTLDITTTSGGYDNVMGMLRNRFRNNECHASAGTRDNTENAKTIHMTLADTSAHDIVEVYDEAMFQRRAIVGYTLIGAGAGSTVTVVVEWNAGGSTFTKTLASGAHAAGNYTVIHEVDEASTLATNYMKVTAQCSTANVLRVDAEIVNW